jgi:hypothetical protein
MSDRTWWNINDEPLAAPKHWWDRWSWRKKDAERREPGSYLSESELVSSMCKDGWHMPALDIDFPAALIPSSTYGHFHLYLNKRMPWWKYKRLLRALAQAGIIEWGYYRLSRDRKQSFLWRPGLPKQNARVNGGNY